MAKYHSLRLDVPVTVSMVVTAMFMFASPPQAEAAMSCDTVATALSPCIIYVLSGWPAPTLDCCNGARSLLGQAQSTPDRQTICSCLKSVASSATPAIISNAAGLPAKCGISIPYKISPSTDCSKIQ